MAESERIEILHFDQERYLKEGSELRTRGEAMVRFADQVADEGYDAVFLLGMGGTWDELMQLEYIMNLYADKDLELHLLNAAEWNVLGSRHLTERSVVLTSSESGTTVEVLEAVGKMRGQGIRVYALTNPDSPIGQAVGAERCVPMSQMHGTGSCEMNYYLADCFGLRLLYRRGCFPDFDRFMSQSDFAWQGLVDLRKAFEPRAEEIARRYALAPYTMFVGSGALWGETILFAMCNLEECQWKRVRYVTSPDFFHGTLELVEPGVPVFLFKGEDASRKLDERVERFLKSGVTGDEDIVIVDTKEHALPGIDEDLRVIFSPWILSALVGERVCCYYEMMTKHNLNYRRYYHQFDY